MSKDPAVLFYTSDFISGTLTMSDAQRGKYIMLLCLQHQQGMLNEDDMINICKTYDDKIYKKFIKTDEGFYYNERMKREADRRKNYSESRRKNREPKDNKICKTYDEHMETETITINKKRKGKPFKAPIIEEVIQYFEDNGYIKEAAIKAFNYYSVADWHDKNGGEVKNWKQKMIQVWFKEENKKGYHGAIKRNYQEEAKHPNQQWEEN